jgi:hypothetical protein
MQRRPILFADILKWLFSGLRFSHLLSIPFIHRALIWLMDLPNASSEANLLADILAKMVVARWTTLAGDIDEQSLNYSLRRIWERLKAPEEPSPFFYKVSPSKRVLLKLRGFGTLREALLGGLKQVLVLVPADRLPECLKVLSTLQQAPFETLKACLLPKHHGR